MPKSSATGKLREYQRKRDFSKTREPAGDVKPRSHTGLEFVIQKHAASHLHFDLRLELEGVMKSWAVPKGPSLDPSSKRLAVEVEDHPMDYNNFEGTIPAGEYGGGTVMLWDRGTYEPDEVRVGEEPEKALKRGYHKGKISFTLHGERLRGSFALVRTDAGDGQTKKPQWLLIKHQDDFADPERDIVQGVTTSVDSGRTMSEIAAGKGKRRVWRSNRQEKPRIASKSARPKPSAKLSFSAFSPMLCETAKELPKGPGWTFEPKLDGMRVIALATPDAATLISRNGNDKSRQFPEVIRELTRLAAERNQSLVLDGEVVGLDARGKYLRFESLQGRMHVQDTAVIKGHAEARPSAFVAFDILVAGADVLVDEPWTARRRRLEQVLQGQPEGVIRLEETSTDGDAVLRRAQRADWEGIIAKRVDAKYQPGKRSRDWLKLKIENQQEFVVGGWTEPRNSRKHLGAILLGYYDSSGEFVYAGHTGTGFTQKSLEEMYRRLRRLERKTSPFKQKPKTNEPAHWTSPKLVVEIKFNEWTREGKLRQPSFLGFREDKDPASVIRELESIQQKQPARKAVKGHAIERKKGPSARDPSSNPVVKQILGMMQAGGSGTLSLGRGHSLELTNLSKVFYPKERITKGDLLTYYAEMSEYILPWMEDRPLVLKRYPNGIDGESFYQQSAPDEAPDGVRIDVVRLGSGKKQQPRFVGGTLATLLYTIQLGAVSYDPWHSRMGNLEVADYTILDLDPGPGASFQRVVQVARWVKDEMDELGLHGAIKTSGSSGIHIYLPLPADTSLEAATLVAQIIATRVAQKHPREATIERMTRKRPRGTVYVDYLQNILGKTVSGVYAARAKAGATVSTPLDWGELTTDLDMHDFTIKTVPSRVKELGDLWGPAMTTPNSLHRLLRRS